MRVEAIKGSSVCDDLVKKFQQLFEETFRKPFEHTAPYLSTASLILGSYLVSLALFMTLKGFASYLRSTCGC